MVFFVFATIKAADSFFLVLKDGPLSAYVGFPATARCFCRICCITYIRRFFLASFFIILPTITKVSWSVPIRHRCCFCYAEQRRLDNSADRCVRAKHNNNKRFQADQAVAVVGKMRGAEER